MKKVYRSWTKVRNRWNYVPWFNLKPMRMLVAQVMHCPATRPHHVSFVA